MTKSARCSVCDSALTGSWRPRAMTGGTSWTRRTCWPSSGWPGLARAAGPTSDHSTGRLPRGPAAVLVGAGPTCRRTRLRRPLFPHAPAVHAAPRRMTGQGIDAGRDNPAGTTPPGQPRRDNAVTRELFARYRTATDYAAADRAELEKLIQPTGYFRAKAKSLIALGQALCDRFGGEVPDTLDELVTLPGVGRKTANVVLGDAFGKPSLTVDTHFARLARRFGWTAQTDPNKIERDVGALLPRRDWTAASHRVIWHGRRVCHARRPACGACGVAKLCPSFGEGPTDVETARKLVKTGPFS